MNLESCPSWPKEHDWKSCNRSKPVRGFESLALRQNEKQVARPAFCFGKTKRGIRTRREQTCLRKKTVRWTVFADVVKERSDAKVHGSAPKKSLALRQNEKQVARPAFCFGKTKRGIRTRREQTCLRKKTVRWTVFADVVKERSDAKVHGSAPKKSLALRHKSTVILIELRWTFSMPESRLKGRLT